MIKFSKTTHKNLVDPEKPAKTYAQAQTSHVISLSDFAEHIAAHKSKYGKGDILAVVTELATCLREQLLLGNKVKLGDLGSFWLGLQSKGVCESVIDPETKKKPIFTAANITGINVKWEKAAAFASANMMKSATFEEVQTREANALALKEKKAQLAAGTYNKKEEEPEVEVHE